MIITISTNTAFSMVHLFAYVKALIVKTTGEYK